MKKQTKNQSFIEGKGFYIALCSCIAVLGVIAYVGNSAGRNKAEKSHEASDNIVVEEKTLPQVTEQPAVTAVPSYRATTAPSVQPKPTAAPPRPSSAVQTKTAAVETAGKADITETAAAPSKTEPPAVSFTSPVEGKIIATFSESLTYNKTMDDWRTHNGVDISAKINEPVKASCDGTVEETGADTLGMFVILTHENGFRTLYANLNEENTAKLQKGDKVKTGDVIGYVGESTIAEKLTDSHLHFEILKDGENMDPLEFIK